MLNFRKIHSMVTEKSMVTNGTNGGDFIGPFPSKAGGPIRQFNKYKNN